MKVLVIGAARIIGKAAANALAARHEVIRVSRKSKVPLRQRERPVRRTPVNRPANELDWQGRSAEGRSLLMRLLVITLLVAACGPPAPLSTSVRPAPVVAVVPSAAPEPAKPLVPATWGAGDGPHAFVRSEGPGAKPVVLRGIVTPTGATSYPTGCSELFGARPTAAATLSVRGPARDVFVFARARGPFGLSSGNDCSIVRPNQWAKLRVSLTEEPVQISVADTDLEGERRGQTSPYVLVLEDDDQEPTDEPLPRMPAAATDTTVRWDLVKTECKGGPDYGQCYTATLVLGGAYKKRIPVGRIWGQALCAPEDTGIMCGGASGQADVRVELSGDTLRVVERAVSDGYCPPPEDCSSSSVRAKVKVRAGLHLVADPEGTFPSP